MSQRGQVTEKADAKRIIRPAVASVFLGAIVCACLLLLLALIVSSVGIPQPAIDPMALFAVGVGAFAAGFFCSKIVGANGLMCGFFCGAAFSVIVLVCSFAVPDNVFGMGALYKSALMLFSAMVGGVVGINVKLRKK